MSASRKNQPRLLLPRTNSVISTSDSLHRNIHRSHTNNADQVIVSLTNLQKGLSHVQDGINDLLGAYMKHTSSILAGESGQLESLQFPLNIEGLANATQAANHQAAAAMAAAGAAGASGVAAAAGDGTKRKRKRDKKERDPNAPKRPLTAAFLYGQHARPIVKRDLEANLPPDAKLPSNAVNLEVTKRWNAMPEEDKELWRASYRSSMEKFKEDLKEYEAKTGAKLAEVHEEDEATDEAEVGAVDTDADASDDSDNEGDHGAGKAPSPPPVANTKTPRANKRQKTTVAATPQTNGNAASTPVPIAAAPPISHVPVPVGMGMPVRPSFGSVVPLPVSSAVELPTAAPTPAKKEKAKKDKKDREKEKAATPAKSPEKKKARSTRQQEAAENAENHEATTAAPEKEKRKRDSRKRKSEGVNAA
ncbi:hypothetical protein GQ43DRAFT_436506 [Delitschia confertaspora ATCC 74209]|uniref:HMG box domain-containing protein n=1 Tax=Delitschia confertaspora ATCC 74209 TaxID=1513339 RepID=A0A9P4JV13_9PLEO|nr:hypothetical protein GQ43DRAFT_436506 [Delitschia confertaspora ATCC 74209]